MWKKSMLIKNKIRTQRQQNGIYIYSLLAMISCIVMLLNYIDSLLNLGAAVYFNYLYIVIIILLFTFQIAIWAMSRAT